MSTRMRHNRRVTFPTTALVPGISRPSLAVHLRRFKQRHVGYRHQRSDGHGNKAACLASIASQPGCLSPYSRVRCGPPLRPGLAATGRNRDRLSPLEVPPRPIRAFSRPARTWDLQQRHNGPRTPPAPGPANAPWPSVPNPGPSSGSACSSICSSIPRQTGSPPRVEHRAPARRPVPPRDPGPARRPWSPQGGCRQRPPGQPLVPCWRRR